MIGCTRSPSPGCGGGWITQTRLGLVSFEGWNPTISPMLSAEPGFGGFFGDTLMKIIACDGFKPGVTRETIKPYLPEEVASVWRLWKAGIVREFYARTDVPGAVVIVFECKDVDEVKRYVADFPMSKQGFLDWSYIALDAPLPLESLFDPKVDVNEPYDRTKTSAGR
jgi:hypothetical protein